MKRERLIAVETQLVRIQEIREKCISIEAETLEEAIKTVEELYSNGDIRLTVDDISDVEFD